MKLTLRQLRESVREVLTETEASQTNKPYSISLMDDDYFSSKSLYVADDVKEKIRAWAKKMGLS